MKKKINEKNELMKKRSLIVEGEREEFKTPKFYLLETEDVNIGIIKLVTKYRAGLEAIIQKITSSLENRDEFCRDPKAHGEELKVLITNYLERIAEDSSKNGNKVTPVAVLDSLYKKLNSPAFKIIFNIAAPIVKNMATGFGLESGSKPWVSKEIIDSIEELMKSEYGQDKINTLISEIFKKLGADVIPICQEDGSVMGGTPDSPSVKNLSAR